MQIHCEYDLEGAELYSLKWYKNSAEFFRIMPSMSQHTQVTALCVTCHLGADLDPGVPGGRGPGGGGGLLPLQAGAC